MSIDARLAGIAAAQHGVITRKQALAAGAAPHHITHRCRSGIWTRLHPGVYAASGAPRTRLRSLLAACVAAGEGAVVSHRSAAELWSLDGVEQGFTDITVSTSHTRTLHGVEVHRSRDLRPQHVTERSGLPVTNPMRTVVDLGLVVPWWTVRDAMDDALGRKLVSEAGLVSIWREVARPGRNGSGVLRRLLEERLPRPSASKLERAMVRLHRTYDLPEPEVEVEIRDPGGRFLGRVDFCHAAARIIIETDGYATHSSRESFAADRRRDRRLRALGWTVLRYTWMEVVHTPAEVARELREFFASESPE